MHESETTFEAQETELFTITLKATPDERLIVRSAEVICVGSRVRFTFAADSEPEKVFAPDAARAVRKLTERVVSQRGMLILQDFAVNLASIVLSDCRAVAADISDGGCQIMLRFKRFVGDLLSFFSSDYEPKLRLGSVTDRNAVRLIEHAYLPLADFADHASSLRREGKLSPGDENSDALFSIVERIRALEICRSMVKEAIDPEYRQRRLPQY